MIEGIISILLIFILFVFIVVKFAKKFGKGYYKRKRYKRYPKDYPTQTAEEKGKDGELCVRCEIGITVPYKKYVFNDYVLKIGDDTAQIDHIVVTRRGVFVIETKNYSGQIYGSENDREWTQVLNFGGKKNSLFNPIMQNEGHIKKLKLVLGDIPFRSVIVFVQANIENLKTDKVIPINRLGQVLNSGDEVLTEAQIVHINEVLSRRNCREQVSDVEHVNNIKVKQERVANNLCPYCGKDLVLKDGKYGQFLGCPNYPKCKYTKKI